MDAPMNPKRRVYRQKEEEVYDDAPVVYEQPYTPVQPVQPVVPVQPVYSNPAPTSDVVHTYSQGDGVQVERTRQGYYDPEGNLIERDEQVYDDPYTRRLNILDRVVQIMYFLTGALEVLLGLRLIFRLINSSTANGLVNFVYNLSAPFVGAFNGIFNDQSLGRGSVLEFSTIIAMLIYALLCWGMVQLLYVLFTPGYRSREVYSVTRRRRS
jgi:hypothetical protein